MELLLVQMQLRSSVVFTNFDKLRRIMKMVDLNDHLSHFYCNVIFVLARTHFFLSKYIKRLTELQEFLKNMM